MTDCLRKLGRRELLALGGSFLAASGLGVVVLRRLLRPRVGDPIEREGMLSPSAFVAIDGEGVVHVWVPRSEMGQGVRTGLAMIVADALDTDFARVVVSQAPIDPRFGEMATVGSASVRGSLEALERAGASLRWMLVEAAAVRWGLDVQQIDTEPDVVVARGGSLRASYRDLLEETRARSVPRRPPRRTGPPRVLGTSPPRVDLEAKVRGTAVFGIDVRPPGLRYAVLVRPSAGVRIEQVQEARAREVPGVLDVVRLDALGAWAVVASSTWAAMRGREALAPRRSTSVHRGLDDRRILEMLREATRHGEHTIARRDFDESAYASERGIEVEMSFPFLAHATMEPLNCTVQFDRARSRAKFWAPTQHPVLHRAMAAEILHIAPEDIEFEIPYLGGGFGRRAEGDEIREAAHLAQALVGRVEGPIQLVWSRDDDLQFDTFRPAAAVLLRAIITSHRRLDWLDVSVATPADEPERAQPFAVEGLESLLEAAPAHRLRWTGVRCPVRTGIWRSVAHSYTAFVAQHGIEVLAHRAGISPSSLRDGIVARDRRLAAVLDRARAMAAGVPSIEGRARGEAAHACFGSHAAMVAEVSADAGRVRVHRVWAAVDCGRVVSPDLVRQQIEGGALFGLSAALFGRIPIVDGQGAARSFVDYRLLRMPEAPEVHVEIVASDEAPGGVGELGVPCIAPAIANALFAMTARAQTGLPLSVADAFNPPTAR